MRGKTLIEKEGYYCSFPTVTEHNGKIHMFFREARSAFPSPHGIEGVIKHAVLEKEYLIKAALPEKIPSETVFSSGYEMDAIVSNPRSSVFTLCTRTFNNTTTGTYISVSDNPEFKDRIPVHIEGIKRFVFYGKPIYKGGAYLFSAYGITEQDTLPKAILLGTHNFEKWEILSLISIKGAVLNEFSLVEFTDTLHAFLRQDNGDFGIWHSSKEPHDWSKPHKLFSGAHAPTTLNMGNFVLLFYRRIFAKNLSGVAMRKVLPCMEKETVVDEYPGNIYDGGYSDAIPTDNGVLLFYYRGNLKREPTINYRYIGREEI